MSNEEQGKIISLITDEQHKKLPGYHEGCTYLAGDKGFCNKCGWFDAFVKYVLKEDYDKLLSEKKELQKKVKDLEVSVLFRKKEIEDLKCTMLSTKTALNNLIQFKLGGLT